jgi:HEAT repeat protein
MSNGSKIGRTPSVKVPEVPPSTPIFQIVENQPEDLSPLSNPFAWAANQLSEIVVGEESQVKLGKLVSLFLKPGAWKDLVKEGLEEVEKSKQIQSLREQATKELQTAEEIAAKAILPEERMQARSAYQKSGESFAKLFAKSGNVGDAKSAAHTFYAAARLARGLGKAEEAKELFSRGITLIKSLNELPPEDPNHLNWNRAANELLGDGLTAIESYSEAIKIYRGVANFGELSPATSAKLKFVERQDEARKSLGEDFFARLNQLETNERQRVQHGLSLLQRANAIFFPPTLEAMGEELTREARERVIAFLQSPSDLRKAVKAEIAVIRLEGLARGRAALEELRRNFLQIHLGTEAPQVVDHILKTGDWSVLHRIIVSPSLLAGEGISLSPSPSTGEGWGEGGLPIDLHPKVLENLSLRKIYHQLKQTNPEAAKKFDRAIEIFQRPEIFLKGGSITKEGVMQLPEVLSPGPKFDPFNYKLGPLEDELKTYERDLFQLDPKTRRVPINPLTGEKIYAVQPFFAQLVHESQKASVEENPTQFIRHEIQKIQVNLQLMGKLFVTFEQQKKDLEQTEQLLEQARKAKDTTRVAQLEKKLVYIQKQLTKAERFVKASAEEFLQGYSLYLKHAKKLGVVEQDGTIPFERELEEAKKKIEALVESISPSPPLTLRGGTKAPPLRVRGGWEGILPARLQTLTHAQSTLLKSLAFSNAAVAGGFRAGYWRTTKMKGEGLQKEWVEDREWRNKQERLVALLGKRGTQIDIQKFLQSTEKYLRETDQALFKKFPDLLKEGIEGQLKHWQAIRETLRNKGEDTSDADRLIGYYQSAESALRNKNFSQALVFFKLANDSRRYVRAMDEFEWLQTQEAIKDFSLQLAISIPIVMASAAMTGAILTRAAPTLSSLVQLGTATGRQRFAYHAIHDLLFFASEKTVRYLALREGLLESHGKKIHAWDLPFEVLKTSGMLGTVRTLDRYHKMIAVGRKVMADPTTKKLIQEAMKISPEVGAGLLQQKILERIAKMGELQRFGFKAKFFGLEVAGVQGWNNFSAILDGLYQNLFYKKDFDLEKQLAEANTPQAIAQAIAFPAGLRLAGLVVHPLHGKLAGKRSKIEAIKIQHQLKEVENFLEKKQALEVKLVDVNFQLDDTAQKEIVAILKQGDQLFSSKSKLLQSRAKDWREARELLNGLLGITNPRDEILPILEPLLDLADSEIHAIFLRKIDEGTLTRDQAQELADTVSRARDRNMAVQLHLNEVGDVEVILAPRVEAVAPTTAAPAEAPAPVQQPLGPAPIRRPGEPPPPEVERGETPAPTTPRPSEPILSAALDPYRASTAAQIEPPPQAPRRGFLEERKLRKLRELAGDQNKQDEKERLDAMRELGTRGDLTAGPLLQRIFRNPREPSMARQVAAYSLGLMKDRSAIPLLEEVAETKSPSFSSREERSLELSMRFSALRALMDIGDVRVLDLFARIIDDPREDALIVEEAVKAMGQKANQSDNVIFLLSLETRLIGRLRTIVEMIDQYHKNLGRWSHRSRSERHFREMLAGTHNTPIETSLHLRREILFLLGKMRDIGAITRLLNDAMNPEGILASRNRIIITFGEWGFREAIPVLENLLNDPDPSIRASAQTSLQKLRINNSPGGGASPPLLLFPFIIGAEIFLSGNWAEAAVGMVRNAAEANGPEGVLAVAGAVLVGTFWGRVRRIFGGESGRPAEAPVRVEETRGPPPPPREASPPEPSQRPAEVATTEVATLLAQAHSGEMAVNETHATARRRLLLQIQPEAFTENDINKLISEMEQGETWAVEVLIKLLRQENVNLKKKVLEKIDGIDLTSNLFTERIPNNLAEWNELFLKLAQLGSNTASIYLKTALGHPVTRQYLIQCSLNGDSTAKRLLTEVLKDPLTQWIIPSLINDLKRRANFGNEEARALLKRFSRLSDLASDVAELLKQAATTSAVVSDPPSRAMNPQMAQERPDLAQQTKQVLATEFPEPIRQEILSLITDSEVKGHEYVFYAIEIDGEFFISRPITSFQEKTVTDQDLNVLSDLLLQVGRSKNSSSSPVKFYAFHTHPYRPPTVFTETPVWVHTDGRPYTEPSLNDYAFADGRFQFLSKNLRQWGFTGPIEMLAGPIPSGIETAHVPYVSTYSRSEGVPSESTPAPNQVSSRGGGRTLPVLLLPFLAGADILLSGNWADAAVRVVRNAAEASGPEGVLAVVGAVLVGTIWGRVRRGWNWLRGADQPSERTELPESQTPPDQTAPQAVPPPTPATPQRVEAGPHRSTTIRDPREFIRVLNDPTATLADRRSAIGELTRLGTPEGVQALVMFLDRVRVTHPNHENLDVALVRSAVRVLGELDADRAIEVFRHLLQIAKSEGRYADFETVGLIFDALEKVRGDTSTRYLLAQDLDELLYHPEHLLLPERRGPTNPFAIDFHLSIAHILAKWGMDCTRAIEVLRWHLNTLSLSLSPRTEENHTLRIRIIGALGELHDYHSVGLFLSILGNPQEDIDIHDAVMVAFKSMKSDDLVNDILPRIYSTTDPRFFDIFKKVLVHLGEARSVDQESLWHILRSGTYSREMKLKALDWLLELGVEVPESYLRVYGLRP